MRTKKIVIIGDYPIPAQTTDTCLSKRGHDVKVFYTGADAVKCLFEEKPGYG